VQAIIFSSCGFSFFLFFLIYSQPSQIGCLPYFHTWYGLSVNLECRSEMCCTQLTENTVHKKLPKVQHLGTIAQLFCAASSQLRHVLTIEKNLLKSNISFHKSPKCDELRPTNGWDRFGGLGHPANFNWFVTAATSLTGGQPNLARCLAVFWAATLYIYIYIRELLPPWRICQVQSSLYIQVLRSILAALLHGTPATGVTRQPNFAAWYEECNYGTFAEGTTYIRLGSYHVGHWHTF